MILALDISTSVIGYAVFGDDNLLLEMDYIKFNSKNDIFEKFTIFTEKIAPLLKMGIDTVVIEEPLKKFKGKFSSANTIAILNFFNGMISSYIMSAFKVIPMHYNVNNARTTALPGFKLNRKSEASSKHQIWEQVVKLEPQINWKYGVRSRKLLTENYDMIDAYIVGLCHIKLLEAQKKSLV